MGDRMTERVEVEVILWRHLSSMKSLPFLTGWNLFPMHPGCPAALSAPWSARVPGPIAIGGVTDWGLVNFFICRDFL